MLNISAQIGKTVSATFFRAFAGVRSLNMVIKHKPAPAMLDAVIEHVVSAFSPKLGKQHACNCTLDALQRTASLFGRDPDQHIECMLCTLEFFHRNGMALPPNFDTNIFIEALKSVAAVHYQGLKQRPVETYLRAAMALKDYNIARTIEQELLRLAYTHTFGAGAEIEEQVLDAQLDFNLRQQSFDAYTVSRLIGLKQRKPQDAITKMEVAELKLLKYSKLAAQEVHDELTELLPRLAGASEFCLAAELLGRACTILGRHAEAIEWLRAAGAKRRSADHCLAEALMNAGDHEMAARVFRELYRGEVTRRTEAVR